MKSTLQEVFEKKYGKPSRIIQVEKDQQSFLLAVMAPIEEEDIYDTMICSLGLAEITGSYAECIMEITGKPDDEAYREIGELFYGVLQQIKPDDEKLFAAVLHNCHLSFLPDKTAALLFDHGGDEIKFLDAPNQKGRLLDMALLFEKEAAVLEKRPVHLRYRMMSDAVVDYTDPDRKEVDLLQMAFLKLWKGIAAWTDTNAVNGSKRLIAQLSKTVDRKNVQELEEGLGVSLPEDLIYALPVMARPGIFLGEFECMSKEEMIETSRKLKEMNKQGKFAKGAEKIVEDSNIKSVWWHPHWIPFAMNSTGDMLCIDMAPGETGVAGQVLLHYTDSGPCSTNYSSFYEWLLGYLKDLLEEKYECSDGGFLIKKST